MKTKVLWTVASVLLLVASTATQAQDQSGNRTPSDMVSQAMTGCPGMAGQGMMGMGSGMRGPNMMGMMPSEKVTGPWGHPQGFGLRIMMILMDSDGDGALSLEEVQSAHARIFKAVDANKDGKVTVEEMQQFFRGGASDRDDE